MSESSEWLIKIISGPHQGAEVPLQAGRLVVGANPEADLVLHDVLVAPNHVAVSLEQGVVTIEPLDGPVFVNGKRAKAPTAVPPFGFVTAGTTHLVLGPAAGRWPLLSLADVPPLEKEPESAPVAAASAPASATAATTGDSAAETGKPGPKAPTPDQRRRAWWTAGVGAVLLIVWIGLWLAWTPRTAATPAPTARERAERVLAAFPTASEVRLVENGERLVASGYVDSDSAARELAAAFREDAPEVSVRIWSTSRMLETARTLLAAHQLPLEVIVRPGGELVVTGSVGRPDQWQKARQMLLAEVPGLDHLSDEVRVASATVAQPSPTAPRAVSAPVSITALQDLGGGQGWLRLSTGAVLFRGATLPIGGHIAEFAAGRAIIEQNGARLELAIGASLPVVGGASTEPASREGPAVALSPETDPQKG